MRTLMYLGTVALLAATVGATNLSADASPSASQPLPISFLQSERDFPPGLVSPGPGSGVPQGIDFNGAGLVSHVVVTLDATLFKPGHASPTYLEMTITSVNGTNHFHGSDLIPLTEVVPFFEQGGLVEAIIVWTQDQEPMVINDVYTVCARLVRPFRNFTWIGPLNCIQFGPF